VTRFPAFVCHPPQIFEVIQNLLDLNRAAGWNIEPDSAAVLDAEALP